MAVRAVPSARLEASVDGVLPEQQMVVADDTLPQQRLGFAEGAVPDLGVFGGTGNSVWGTVRVG
jgi:hypothetical protein